MKTIINAIKAWVKNDAFTADDALEAAIEMEVIIPVMSVDGVIYTSPEGDIYTLD